MPRGGEKHRAKRFGSVPDDALAALHNVPVIPCDGCGEPHKMGHLRKFPDEQGWFCYSCHKVLVGTFVPLEGRTGSLNSYYLSRYGLTFRAYATMYLAQSGKCLICEAIPEDRRLVVDHCHTGGQVRGLLCSTCNSGLGMFKDSVPNLARAILYLS